MKLVDFVVYDENTGEIIQSGYMDEEAYEKHPVEQGQGKAKVPENEVWKLLGDFIEQKREKGSKPERMFMFDKKTKKLKEKPKFRNKASEIARQHNKRLDE